MRWKNPHPKRAENARTVLKGDLFLEEERGGEEEQPVAVLCLKIPVEDDEVVGDDVEIQNEMRKEKTTETKRGGKRKRKQQHECGVCERIPVGQTRAYAHERETV